MSGGRAQHLQRRSGIFHLRIRVPDDLRSLVGLTEVRRSLHTYQSSRARLLAAVCAARVFEVFEMVRTREFSKDQVRGLVRGVFEEMKQEVDRSVPRRMSDWELNEQLYCSTEMTAMVRAQQATGGYDRHVELIAERALKPTAARLVDLPATSRDDLRDGAARAFVERERLYQFRLSDRLAPFTPRDPLFAQSAQGTAAHQQEAIGPTLGDAIDAYLAIKKKSWTPKTYVIRERYLGYLREHFGDAQMLCALTPADVRGFRDHRPAAAQQRKGGEADVCGEADGERRRAYQRQHRRADLRADPGVLPLVPVRAELHRTESGGEHPRRDGQAAEGEAVAPPLLRR